MKRKIIILCTLILLTLFNLSSYAENSITVKIDDRKVNFMVEPIIENNKVLIPVRDLFHILGFSEKWIEDSSLLILKKNDMEIKLEVPSELTERLMKEYGMDIHVRRINDIIYIEADFLERKLGAKVDWDKESKTLKVNTEYIKLGMALSKLSNKGYIRLDTKGIMEEEEFSIQNRREKTSVKTFGYYDLIKGEEISFSNIVTTKIESKEEEKIKAKTFQEYEELKVRFNTQQNQFIQKFYLYDSEDIFRLNELQRKGINFTNVLISNISQIKEFASIFYLVDEENIKIRTLKNGNVQYILDLDVKSDKNITSTSKLNSLKNYNKSDFRMEYVIDSKGLLKSTKLNSINTIDSKNSSVDIKKIDMSYEVILNYDIDEESFNGEASKFKKEFTSFKTR